MFPFQCPHRIHHQKTNLLRQVCNVLMVVVASYTGNEKNQDCWLQGVKNDIILPLGSITLKFD